MRRLPSILLVSVFLLASHAYAQTSWETTPYEKWTKSQVMEILSESPWARTFEFKTPSLNTTRVRTTDQYPATAKIMLRSALPVRRAMLRLRQLEAGYDKMSEAERVSFDSKNSALIECPACDKYYVVWIKSNFISMANDTYAEGRKSSVYLSNDLGEKRELAEFTFGSRVQDRELIFFFPRLDEAGRPLLTPATKKLHFTFQLKFLHLGFGTSNETVAFKVADITRDNVVLF